MAVDVEVVKDAVYLRGLFVNRYSAIEFGLTHLLVVARESQAYPDLNVPPFKLASKLRSLRSLIEQAGPLAAHAAQLSDPLAYFESIEESRHLIVHGVMVPTVTEGETLCRFRVYQHREGEFAEGRWDVPLAQLREFVDEVGQHSRHFSSKAASIARDMIAGAPS